MDVFQVANYKDYLFDTAKTIFGIDSPTGYYHAVIKKVEEIATGLGYQFEQIEKGCGIITIEGEDNSRTVMMAAHVDTLGLMVAPSPQRASSNSPRLAAQSCQLLTASTAASAPETARSTPAPSCARALLYMYIQMLPPEQEKKRA